MSDIQTPAAGAPRRRTREEKELQKKEARKLRRRARAGRAEGERATLGQLINEYTRAAILRVGKDSRDRLNRILANSSRVGDPPWFESDQFPWMKTLEDNWETIRDEAAAVMEGRDLLPAVNEISPDHDRLSSDGTWKSYFLYGYGNRMERSCARCPETAKLLDTVPNLSSGFFSILEPGGHLPRHRGPTKAIVTWHLGLIIPMEREKCWIEVTRQRRLWGEGESLVFDDAQKHEVLNESDEERVVLLVHFARPMRFPGSWLGPALMRAIGWSPFVSDGRRNNLAFEDRFEQAMAKRDSEQAASQ